MKLEKVKLTIAIVIGLIAIAGTLLTVNNYFAKTEDVDVKISKIEEDHKQLEAEDELVQERLDISITDDQIF